MPVANVTASRDKLGLIISNDIAIRRIVADQMSTKQKVLTPEQVSLRVHAPDHFVGIMPVEIEVFAHAFWYRVRHLDKRAFAIAHAVADLLEHPCGCWINLNLVGYSNSANVGFQESYLGGTLDQ